MNHLTIEKAKMLMKQFNIPHFFNDVLDEKLSYPLDIYFTCPVVYFLNKEEQAAYMLGDIIPLWADIGGYIHYAYDINQQIFISFDIEEGSIEKRYSWDEIMKKIIGIAIEYECDEHDSIEQTIGSVKDYFACIEISNFDLLAEKCRLEYINS